MYRELQTQIWAQTKEEIQMQPKMKQSAEKLIKVKTPTTPCTVDFNLFTGNS